MTKMVAVFLVIAFSTAACARTAQITEIDHTVVYGRIVGGSRSSVIIEQEDGVEHRISRRDIKNVRHPGGVLEGLGGGLLVVAVLTGVLALTSQGSRNIAAGAIVPGTTGLTLAVIGGILSSNSQKAMLDVSHPLHQYSDRDLAPVMPPLNPPVLRPEGPPEPSFP